MEKGYYTTVEIDGQQVYDLSQSTIKMEKGYYLQNWNWKCVLFKAVAIHNKNGKGLLPTGML